MLNSAAADAARIDAYLARFVPTYRRQLLRQRQPGRPAARRLTAAVLYVDIVGFTSLTGRMTQNQVVGAERIAADVNAVLAGIAGIAARHGGEVVHFAGDAAWIGWFAPAASELAGACHRAAAAALAVQAEAGSWLVGGQAVELRAALGAGALEQLELGGEQGRWCGLLLGPAIADAVAADRFGAAGAIVASPTAWRYIEAVGGAAEIAEDHVRIVAVKAVRSSPPPAADLAVGTDGAALPDIIAARAAPGPGRWSGEFRTCHIVFGRLAAGDRPADADTLHRAVAEIQHTLDRSNGSLYQLLSDEKGIAVIAAYGLPPRASGTDGARALEAAATLHGTLAGIGLDGHFGVAVGRTFCTVYGAGDQLQLALVGPAINRAARLAETGEAIVADAAVVDAGVPPTLAARPLPPRLLKGFAEPVATVAITRAEGERADATAGAAPDLVGREAELDRGVARIAALRGGSGGLLLVEGDAGAGKSALAAALLANAASASLATARGAGDEIERAVEYRPWRQALRTLLADAVDAGGRLSDGAAAALGASRPYASLLSRLVDHAPPDEAETARLTDEARAVLVREMAVALLAARARRQPMVLLLEDLHWFDSPSLALLEALLDMALPILVIATTRGGESADGLADGPGRERIVLAGLEPGQSARLLARTCGAPSVDDALAARVHALSNGNPFFITQLGRFLLEHGRVRVAHGQLVAVDETLSLERAFETYGVPATLEGVVMGRLDALPAADRDTVRVASVLGGSFQLSDLGALKGEAPALTPLLDAGILAQRDGGSADFRHAILRDVAYSTISLADRRRLHEQAARLLAGRAEAAGGQLDAVLAYHFEQAGNLEDAVRCLLRAGAASLRGNANREALIQNEHGLALLARAAPDTRAALREARIDLELGAGEAAQRLSQYDQAVHHKDTALAALGGAIPSGAAVVPALLREIGTQLLRRSVPWLLRDHRPRPSDLRLSAETAELVEIYFYRGEGLRSLYAALRALNLAEGGGDTAQLARGFGIVGTIAGFARLADIARVYGDRALDVLSRIDDSTAAWWVPLVVGVSRLSAGDLAMASRLMDMTAVAAERIRDRRHWRDAIGNQSIIYGLRGDWNGGLALSDRYAATADEDRDTRYIVAAAREQAYFLLQLGRLDEAEQRLVRLRTEIARGLKAEAAASRQDLHAIGATIALARGNIAAARTEAEAGFAVHVADAGASSFPNMYWSLSLLFDAFVRLAESGARQEADRSKAWTLVRALGRHAASHRIGRPAALRARGLYERQFGWAARAGRWLDRAARSASALGIAHVSEPAFASGPEGLARYLPAWLRRGCRDR